MKLVINLNERVTVRLTDAGKAVVREHYKGNPYCTGDKARRLGLLGGEAEYQLWNLMQIFGPHLYLGGPVLFEHKEVAVDPGGS